MQITIKQVGPDVGLFLDDESEARGFIRGVVLTIHDLMDIEGFLSRHEDHLERTPTPAGL